MPSWNEDRLEVERFLNEQDTKRSIRRKHHHLSADAYRSTETIWAITLCARHHGSPFSSPAMANSTVDALLFYRTRSLWRIYAYCLMPDHLHAVIQLIEHNAETPVDLLSLVSRFKRYTTTQVAWKNGLHGHLWQRDLYDHATRSVEDLDAQCRYVLDNPVRKGMVSSWEEYRWCGIPDRWM